MAKSVHFALFAIALSLLYANHAIAKDAFGADKHLARGITCQMCHGSDKDNPQFPDENTCIKCHPKASVAEKSKEINPNPHTAPHNGDCTLCHMQHETPVNYCAQCHQFTYPKVP